MFAGSRHKQNAITILYVLYTSELALSLIFGPAQRVSILTAAKRIELVNNMYVGMLTKQLKKRKRVIRKGWPLTKTTTNEKAYGFTAAAGEKDAPRHRRRKATSTRRHQREDAEDGVNLVRKSKLKAPKTVKHLAEEQHTGLCVFSSAVGQTLKVWELKNTMDATSDTEITKTASVQLIRVCL